MDILQFQVLVYKSDVKAQQRHTGDIIVERLSMGFSIGYYSLQRLQPLTHYSLKYTLLSQMLSKTPPYINQLDLVLVSFSTFIT